MAMGSDHQTNILSFETILLHSLTKGVKTRLTHLIPNVPGVHQYVRMLTPQNRGPENGVAVIAPALPYITIQVLAQLHRLMIDHSLNLTNIIG
jgi:hypothetical protein